MSHCSLSLSLEHPIEQLLVLGKQQLPDSDSALLDVQVLLCFVLGVSRQYLYTWPEKQLNPEQLAHFLALLDRRRCGEPIAYLVGEQEFWSLPLAVSPATLIPRPETELLVELVLSLVEQSHAKGVDLGTGTGAIALALASERPEWELLGVDIQSAAVELAQSNRDKLNLNNVSFVQGSWFEPVALALPGKLDFVVSNPPYIDGEDPHLQQGDVRFEPHSALVASRQGLADLELIARCARDYLNVGGVLLLEHGFEQGDAVGNILQEHGYTQIRTESDLAGQPRVTLGQWPGETICS